MRKEMPEEKKGNKTKLLDKERKDEGNESGKNTEQLRPAANNERKHHETIVEKNMRKKLQN